MVTFILKLLSKITRTKFESKSQLARVMAPFRKRCYQRSQEQSLKANHNFFYWLLIVVWLLSKITRTKFESKSQLTPVTSLALISCYQRSQEQSLKANHNYLFVHPFPNDVVIKDHKNKV